MGRVAVLGGALFVGLAAGLVAQFIRQISGPLMDLGAGTAPWVTIGFVLAMRATRGAGSLGRAAMVGAGTMAAYLLGWLASYHGLFALRESVTFYEAWREAYPWLVVGGPACIVLGIVAARSHRSGILADFCLALPIAWSLPEIVKGLNDGWSYAAIVALPIAVLALLPLVAAGRRDVSPVTVVLGSALMGWLAVALIPDLLIQVHA